MQRFVLAVIAAMAVFAVLLLAFAGHVHEAAATGIPFFVFFGTVHSSLADQTDTTTAFPSQLLTGAGGAQSGTTTDLQGWEGALFSISVGVCTGAGALDGWAQSGSNANASDMANIANSNLTQVLAASNNTVQQIDIYRPTKRYVRIQLNQTVNNVQVGAVVTKYRRSGINPGANVGQPAVGPNQIVKVVQN